ncbi:MAG: hypothetical protein NZ921_05210, partial [Candidatus Caldarchaeum sp.]|nr:hypothetical protein [Candidatus Caldarchaeum sp.]
NTIVTLKVTVREGRIKYRIVPRKTEEVYAGYRVRIVDSLAEELSRYPVRIATSRLGQPVGEVLHELKNLLTSSGKACIVFGSAEKGLKQIAEDLGLSYDSLYTITVNFAPHQAVKTIRTEEALGYTLAIINLIQNDQRH